MILAFSYAINFLSISSESFLDLEEIMSSTMMVGVWTLDYDTSKIIIKYLYKYVYAYFSIRIVSIIKQMWYVCELPFNKGDTELACHQIFYSRSLNQ